MVLSYNNMLAICNNFQQSPNSLFLLIFTHDTVSKFAVFYTSALFQVLSPRNTLNPLSSNKQRKRKNKDGTESIVPDVKVDQKAEENKDPAATVCDR